MKPPVLSPDKQYLYDERLAIKLESGIPPHLAELQTRAEILGIQERLFVESPFAHKPFGT